MVRFPVQLKKLPNGETRGSLRMKLHDADTKRRIISGVATSPRVDLVGDSVQPEGAVYDLPLPLLHMHVHGRPIGWVRRAEVSARGISVVAEIATIKAPGILRDRVDESWQLIASGLVTGLSIGFIPTKASASKTGLKIDAWRWIELSAVVIPANLDGRIDRPEKRAARSSAIPQPWAERTWQPGELCLLPTGSRWMCKNSTRTPPHCDIGLKHWILIGRAKAA